MTIFIEGSKCSKTTLVALTGIQNILEIGKQYFLQDDGNNLFALELEQCDGLDTIENL